MIIDPNKEELSKLHAALVGAVAPRPIAFASTVDKKGNVNLSPFSYFNIFSVNPPILIFAPARRGRDNTTKDTHENLLEVPEVVISTVNYPIVEQMSLSSTEYDKGVNEFIKSGLTPVPSEKVKPPRVAESPVAFECKVNKVEPMGDQGGAGILVICEVLLVHIDDAILDKNQVIDPYKLDAVARMGANWYARAQGDAIFEIPKPLRKLGIGVDQIPESIRNSDVLTGNNLGRLGNVEELPTADEVQSYAKEQKLKGEKVELHQQAKQHLENGEVLEAWKILLFADSL
ncbi:flavin reductase family protein [Fulvivirga sediminis]|uniref:Flavin reductase family protein n=1 Tax=Fulvivirga sediminis TaxID=2803949 RepID=A0A937F4G0_9BACT|nr:flavin reductase family protein [Fulvivirga sediminis]MBL3656181.1 flavin reductase family protein [Fulvivirga sediminis]